MIGSWFMWGLKFLFRIFFGPLIKCLWNCLCCCLLSIKLILSRLFCAFIKLILSDSFECLMVDLCSSSWSCYFHQTSELFFILYIWMKETSLFIFLSFLQLIIYNEPILWNTSKGLWNFVDDSKLEPQLILTKNTDGKAQELGAKKEKTMIKYKKKWE